MAKVLNARIEGKRSPRFDRVYVGRPSIWGNPFMVGRDGTREEVIAKYRAWLETRPDLLGKLDTLAGKDLVCWCAPLPCHADVLLERCSVPQREAK